MADPGNDTTFLPPDFLRLHGYDAICIVLIIIAFLVFQIQRTNTAKNQQPVADDFKKFQRNYVLVYLVMMTGDWLQGPYTYQLYDYYGYSIQDIGDLFIAGFGASMLFGTVVGSMADKYGRKKTCMLFGVMYSLSCLCKNVGDYKVLMVGRLLGGISTSILFSSFEAWMVCRHTQLNFSPELLGLTFSVCTLGNSLVAIGSGLVANKFVEEYGPVAPFNLSLVVLVIGTVIVGYTWDENYGDAQMSVSAGFSQSWQMIRQDPKILMIGTIQSLFEGAMYVFVFMWTPSLSGENHQDIDFKAGWIFASFMVCVLLGSQFFKYLIKNNYKVQNFAIYIFAASALALAIPGFVESTLARYFCFLVFEVCCGMFWPAMGVMRGQYIPEQVRSTVMNLFRVPLNMIVIGTLLNIGKLGISQVFGFCSSLLFLAFLCQIRLVGYTHPPKSLVGV